MTDKGQLLEVVLEAWERSNEILVNLLRSVPEGGLGAKPSEGSPTVAAMFHHMHHERMISLYEEAPEFGGDLPAKEWEGEDDIEKIAAKLSESARRIREAVRSKVEQGRALERSYDHPIFFLQLLMFHEAYHHGQIKLALKTQGHPIPDDVAGPMTWDVWRRRRAV
jgi:uncharacterized damage-inducible protein DinB